MNARFINAERGISFKVRNTDMECETVRNKRGMKTRNAEFIRKHNSLKNLMQNLEISGECGTRNQTSLHFSTATFRNDNLPG